MYKNNIKIGGIKCGHVQGIAVDKKREYMYFSCTTYLAKTDMDGNIIGTVTGIAGHLGCIAYNYDDGKIYASLEVKHDGIGASIMAYMREKYGNNYTMRDGFYVAVFDAEKITEMGMNAEKDGVMTTVYLKEVSEDYRFPGHRYGCSGIDGITFAPVPGKKDDVNHLYVAYGIYGDTAREDNDYQVILRYDISLWDKYRCPMSFETLHEQGPDAPDDKYFVYTGNTVYGIQNLEYDSFTGCMFAAVYRGKKEKFPNFPMFAVDMKQKAKNTVHKSTGEAISELELSTLGERDEKTGIYGIRFGLGSTGMISLGDGNFYFSDTFEDADGNGTCAMLYCFDGKNNFTKI